MLLKLIILTIVVAYAYSQAQESRLVITPQGPVRGYREGNIFVFYSIPYATVPTGVDKFKAPLKAPVWTDTFEAVDRGIVCHQVSKILTGSVTQQEDCLIATVYVPDTEELNLPVVVYIHGGGYQIGWGNRYPPNVLANSQRVIAVTINYRLGAHGFLCLGTEDVPGNAGIKDQIAALHWLKDNIANFGGNSDDITIAGYSAGSTSVDLMILSKSASGLFQKVIPESGANVGVWSVQLDPIKIAKNFAIGIGFTDVDNISELENFYKTASLSTLTSRNDFMNITDMTFSFVPCIERDVGQERFLDDSPVNILRGGDYIKVPMLYGFSQMEGLVRVDNGFFDDWSTRMNEKFSDFLPADLQFESEDHKENVAKEVKQFYFKDESVNETTILNYIDYFSDVMFIYPHLRALRLQVEAGNNGIYLYEYSFTAEEILPIHGVQGPAHCAQTLAVFVDSTSENISNRTRLMYTRMQDIWLNFITKGTPVPEGSSLPPWSPAGANRVPYMDLNEELQLRETLLLLGPRAQFWDKIYDQYYLHPIPPSSSATAASLQQLLALTCLFVLKTLL